MRLDAASSLMVLAMLTGAAQADVFMNGVLATGSHQVAIDSADVRIDTISTIVATTGWGGAPGAEDTFAFPAMLRWPTAIKLFYETESTMVLPVDTVVRDSWYVLPGFGPTAPMVAFHEVGGVAESHRGYLKSSEFSIAPSVTGGSALIRAQLGPSERYDVEVYDAAGNRVRTLAGAATNRGGVSLRWRGEDDLGRRLPEGIYYCALSVGGSHSVRKLVLTR